MKFRSDDIITQIRFPCWLYMPNNSNKNVGNPLTNNTIRLKSTSCNYFGVEGKGKYFCLSTCSLQSLRSNNFVISQMIVKDTIEFVEQKQYSEDEENTDDQLQNLQNSCEFSPPRKKLNQAIAFDSPSSKNKTRKRISPNSNNKSKRNSKK